MKEMEKRQRLTAIVLSFLSLLNVVFVPMFDVWGGLFPFNPERNFWDVMRSVLKNLPETWSEYAVIITMSVFIPTVFMCITSLLNKKLLFTLSSILGILLLAQPIINMAINASGEAVFDLELSRNVQSKNPLNMINIDKCT